MTNTSTARDAIRDAADANGWTIFGRLGHVDHAIYTRGDVRIMVEFTATDAVRGAERTLGEIRETTSARGKRETVLQWLRRPADVDAPLDLAQRVLDAPAGTDEDVVAAELDDEVPAWERNLARLADGPAADRITELERRLVEERDARRDAEDRADDAERLQVLAEAQVLELETSASLARHLRLTDRITELEVQLERATTLATTGANRVRELEAALAESNRARRELLVLMYEDDAAIEGLADAARRLDERAERPAYREVRERVTELEDQRAPLRAAARDLAQLVVSEGRSTARTMRAVQRVGQLTGSAPDLVLVDDATEPPAPTTDPESDLPAADALRALGAPVRRGLPGERLNVTTAAQPATPGWSCSLGVLVVAGNEDGSDRMLTDAGKDASVVPLEYLASYVQTVRALGHAGPARRRAALAQLLAADMPAR